MLLVVSVLCATRATAQSCEPGSVRDELLKEIGSCGGIRLVIGYPPGGNTYLIGGYFERYLKEDLGITSPTIYIETRPGAGGEIAARDVASMSEAESRCRWMVAQSNQLSSNQYFQRREGREGVDPDAAFERIALLAEAPLVLVVNPNVSPHKSVEELVAHLREKGKDAENLYGSNGHFATDHLATLAFLDSRGVTAVHDPRTGSQPMINDLITKTRVLDFSFLSLALIKERIQSGDLRALGIARAEPLTLPDGRSVPSLVNERFQGASIWVALVGKKGMPSALVPPLKRAAACFPQSARARAVADQLSLNLGGSDEELERKIRSEIAIAKEELKAQQTATR
jgi:tripartite-type tricarboxylate transporter receptor subunit TctC